MLISNINTSSNITSYAFVQFFVKCLYIYRPELANNKIETQDQLKKTILYGSTTWSNRTIDCRIRIRSKTAKK